MSQSSDSEFDEPISFEEDYEYKEAEEDFEHGEFDGYPDEADKNAVEPKEKWDEEVAEHRDINHELRLLKELYKSKTSVDEEDEEFLKCLNDDNKLQKTVRTASEVLKEFDEKKESKDVESEDVQTGGGRVRPQRFLTVLNQRKVKGLQVAADKEDDRQLKDTDADIEVDNDIEDVDNERYDIDNDKYDGDNEIYGEDNERYDTDNDKDLKELGFEAVSVEDASYDTLEAAGTSGGINKEKEGDYDKACEDSDEAESKSQIDNDEELARILGGETDFRRHVRVSREVQRLMFSNPGSAIADQFLNIRTTRSQRRSSQRTDESVTPSPQKERKVRQKPGRKPKPTGYTYDQQGRLLYRGTIIGDQCDCLRDECEGCFFPCKSCLSPKCGPICRSQRTCIAYCTADITSGNEPQITRFNSLRKPETLNI
ncbi:unnamed protein product [Bursaphelenchus okinawaensis]|uniref:ARF7 effector protein C-terminal domain-containing protein n=1 Tax=Bursaphelenchus okinawaensis TaxID=465554 RepID=A0A811KTG0_9BILA|nr:unnamed protein product [Bursaphelenchus okinawaensis]CAG9111545.1 unnamed protein product [Bursaphelenchus okinawaensis]